MTTNLNLNWWYERQKIESARLETARINMLEKWADYCANCHKRHSLYLLENFSLAEHGYIFAQKRLAIVENAIQKLSTPPKC